MMPVLVSVTVLIGRVFGARPLRSTDDPFGPVDRDPDVPRDIACDLTARNDVCSPPTIPDRPPPRPTDVDPPNISAAGAGAGLGQLLVILLVAALAVAIGWLIFTVVSGRSSKTADEVDEDLDEDHDDDDATDQRIIDVERPPDRWRRAAQEHRDAGRFRDAVRCQYRGLVGDLARAGIVDEIPGRTSGEERVQLRELAPDVSPTFDVAAGIFDEAWFNDDVVTTDHDERFRQAEQVVLDHVLAGSGVGRISGRLGGPR